MMEESGERTNEAGERFFPRDDWEPIFDEEKKEILRSRAIRGVDAEAGLTGLAISGGGIRSATFALGILQAFARQGQLRFFDYLSTVSGGGYLGSSLSWLLRRAKREDPRAQFGLGRVDFPYGADYPGEEDPGDQRWQQAMLRYLREHGNYLTPGKGITLLAGTAAVLRSMLLNLLVWFPLLVAAFVCLFYVPGLPDFFLPDDVCCVSISCSPERVPCTPSKIAVPDVWPLDGLRWIAGGLALLFLLLCAVYSLGTGTPRCRETTKRVSRYRARRVFEVLSGKLLAATALVAIVASLPWLARWVGLEAAAQGSGLAVVLGMASGLLTFFRTGGGGKLPLGVVATLGAALLLYGFLFLGYWTALHYITNPGVFRWSLAGAVGVALLLGLFVNLNYTGLHRFYRDRLMETFLPPVGEVLRADPASKTPNQPGDYTGPSPRADGQRLSTLQGDGHRGPYHLINAHVVLVDSKDRRYRLRGGDSFVLSPLFSGSGATGWRTTRHFMRDGMTLPTAMAISGAAAHPNTGVGGVGITRSKAVSLLMALLNIRLGYWIRNPSFPQRRLARTPSHFRALLYELGPWFYRENRAHLQISDGGHFENLGLYELVRRQLRLIVVLDGAADPGFAFGDLQTAARRILEDFGARIEFESAANRLERMIPSTDAGYPAGSKVADKGYIVGTITYKDKSQGTLVYLKSTMILGLGLRVKGYKGSHPSFPDESTADQFFDEAQFEAYRELGYRIGESVRSELDAAIRRTQG